MVYSSVVPTEGKFKFNIDPKVRSSENKFCGKSDFSWTNWSGDETVPSTSVLTPAVKWILEFREEQQYSKPVKLMNICSSYNVKTTPTTAPTKMASRK